MENKKELKLAENLLKELNIFENLDDEAKENTPKRFIKALKELTVGYTEPMPELTIFKNKNNYTNKNNYNNKVVKEGISFSSLCPHHLLPYYGKITLTYIPHDYIIGISKIDRLVKWAAKRAITQEDLGEFICYLFSEKVKCYCVEVHIEATHTCNCCRGVESGSITKTVSYRCIKEYSNE